MPAPYKGSRLEGRVVVFSGRGLEEPGEVLLIPPTLPTEKEAELIAEARALGHLFGHADGG